MYLNVAENFLKNIWTIKYFSKLPERISCNINLLFSECYKMEGNWELKEEPRTSFALNAKPSRLIDGTGSLSGFYTVKTPGQDGKPAYPLTGGYIRIQPVYRHNFCVLSFSVLFKNEDNNLRATSGFAGVYDISKNAIFMSRVTAFQDKRDYTFTNRKSLTFYRPGRRY